MTETTRRIHLYLPSLLSTAARLQADYGYELRAPRLLALLNGLNRHKRDAKGLHATLYGHFNLVSSRYAEYCYTLEFGEQADTQKSILRATPIHLISGMTDIAVDPDPVSDLAAEDAQQLCAELNAHFADDGWEFKRSQRGNWYALIPTTQVPASLLTLDSILGQNLYGIIERSDDMRWNRMLNEVQMLLYSSSVNFKRDSVRQRTVSSLWLWGDDYAVGQSTKEQVGQVFGGGFEGEALAHASASQWYESLPTNGDDLPLGASVILLNDHLAATNPMEAEQFQEQLGQVDREVFALLLNQKQRGDEIVIHDGDGNFWQGSKNRLRMLFSRDRRSLLDYI